MVKEKAVVVVEGVVGRREEAEEAVVARERVAEEAGRKAKKMLHLMTHNRLIIDSHIHLSPISFVCFN